MAYFIGLYSKRQKPLGEYADIKDCGQPIQYWGNLDSKKGRKAYPKLREYMFMSLVARTPDIFAFIFIKVPTNGALSERIRLVSPKCCIVNTERGGVTDFSVTPYSLSK